MPRTEMPAARYKFELNGEDFDVLVRECVVGKPLLFEGDVQTDSPVEEITFSVDRASYHVRFADGLAIEFMNIKAWVAQEAYAADADAVRHF